MELQDALEVRETEFAKLAGSDADLLAIQETVKGILTGPAFKASHRSGQSLKYVVELN